MTARWLSFYWSPERQEIACDGERFAHPVATNTSPTHDVAHLVCAASGLPWKPKGTREEICFAEFNAVLLEHLANRALDVVRFGRKSEKEALKRVLEHARWFVEEHYAPFPVAFDEALARFGQALDVGAAVRLAPVLFQTRIFEFQHEDFRARAFGASFSSSFVPSEEPRLHAAKDALANGLTRLRSDFARLSRHFSLSVPT